jgi:GntR family transcriptional regulator
MRLWLSKNSAVPPREQLATQIMLGILSDDLKSGEKMPSTRELARRLDLHHNTLGAAYRELVCRGWLEFRKGSGFFVRGRSGQACRSSGVELEQLIAQFFQRARDEGFSLSEIQSRLKPWLPVRPPDHFLVLEPDEELRRILEVEVLEATGFPTRGAGPEQCADSKLFIAAAPVLWFSKTEQLGVLLPPHVLPLLLHARSVPATLQAKMPVPGDVLIAIVSRWPEFLKWAHAVLVAAGVNTAALVPCDARERGWARSLCKGMIVIADSLIARSVPPGSRLHVFRLIADTSLDELRAFVRNLPIDCGRMRAGRLDGMSRTRQDSRLDPRFRR